MAKGIGLSRVASRNSMRRSESAPSLAPVWEPDGDEQDSEQQANVIYHHSFTGGISPHGGGQQKSAPKDTVLPVEWLNLLASISAGDDQDPRTALREIEIVEAVRKSLCEGGLQLRLQMGLVEQRYELKRQIISGRNFKVLANAKAYQTVFSRKHRILLCR